VVKRDIVRVVTPGTLTEDAFLDPRASNYLAAVVEVRGKLGLAWIELSTGRFSLTCVSRTELVDEIARLAPAEILVSETSLEAPWVRTLRDGSPTVLTSRPSWDFVLEQALKVLNEQFGTTTLAGFGIDDDCPEVQAAGALIAYLRDTQKSAIAHVARLTPYHRKDVLGLDEMTRRSLELTRTLRDARRDGSLLQAIDRTCTPMGARMLGDWLTSPLTSIALIIDRHDAVAELVRDSGLRGDLRDVLDGANDLERVAARVGTCPNSRPG
jgi:DNA mismatch repair protein MutS